MKKNLSIILFLIIVILLVSVWYYDGTVDDFESVEYYTGVKIDRDVSILESYRHFDWMGEGTSYIVFQFTDKQVEQFIATISWEALPYSKLTNLRLLVANVDFAVANVHNDGEPSPQSIQYPIPNEVERGFYFFADATPDNPDDPYIRDYTYALLDLSTNRLYFLLSIW